MHEIWFYCSKKLKKSKGQKEAKTGFKIAKNQKKKYNNKWVINSHFLWIFIVNIINSQGAVLHPPNFDQNYMSLANYIIFGIIFVAVIAGIYIYAKLN